MGCVKLSEAPEAEPEEEPEDDEEADAQYAGTEADDEYADY